MLNTAKFQLQLCNNVEYTVNVSVAAICAWPRKVSISLYMIVEIQVTQLLIWNLARSVTDLRYFLD